jgi:uncharacterized protein
MQILIAFISGLLFGLGLLVGGMANPAKVQGFLDLAGNWDPSLAFVMIGAIAPGLVVFAIVRKRTRSLLGQPIRLPQATRVDRRLALGATTFGIGWGLAGYCPGPALASITLGAKPLIFCGAMLLGMVAFELLERLPRGRGTLTGRA